MTKVLSMVAVGDLHLDGMTADLGDDANRLQIAEIARIEQWAVRNGVRHVVYPGDLCNKAVMSYEAHMLLCKLWNTNSDYLIRHVILGNHDFSEVGIHSLSLLKTMCEQGAFEGSVNIYTEPTEVTLDGVSVNFLPYPWPNIDIPDDMNLSSSVNVAHVEVKGSKRDNGSSSSSKFVADDDAFWLLGHLHTPQEVGDHVHYIGTQYQRNFGEPLPKSFTHVRARMHKGDLQVKAERVEHDPAFRLMTLNVEAQSDLKKVTVNPLHKYKLIVSAAVKLTDQFLSDHPNVVRFNNYKTLRERDVLLTNKVITDQDCEQDDVFDGIDEYLDVKHSYLVADQRTRGTQILTEIRGDLGI